MVHICMELPGIVEGMIKCSKHANYVRGITETMTCKSLPHVWNYNSFVNEILLSPVEMSDCLPDEERKFPSEDATSDVLLQDQGNSRLHVRFNPTGTMQPKSVISQDKGEVSESLINVLTEIFLPEQFNSRPNLYTAKKYIYLVWKYLEYGLIYLMFLIIRL